jgi:tRNA A-37 threonylcarbamoyl transferase component Bud32
MFPFQARMPMSAAVAPAPNAPLPAPPARAATTARRLARGPGPRDAITWQVFDDAGRRLLADLPLASAGELLPAARASGGRIEVIKHGPHRTVYRISRQRPAEPGKVNENYYLKHYRVPNWATWIQNVVRPSKARLEWQAAELVRGAGLPTFEPVALGEVRRRGIVVDSFLLTRSIDGAQPLDSWLLHEFTRLPPAEQQRVRRRLAHALGRLVADVHRAGLSHRDFHAGNILVQWNAGTPRLWLIDLQAVRRRRIGWAAVRKNLSLLNHFFQGRATRADRLAFFRSYLAGSRAAPPSPVESAALTRGMEQYCQRDGRRLWNRQDRHFARGNRHVLILDAEPVRCRGASSLGRELLSSMRDDPESLFRNSVEFWCKTAGKHRVAAVTLSVGSQPTRCYWKQAALRGWRTWLPGRFWSRVRWAFEVGHAFLRRGIPTARPLACLEDRGAGRSGDRTTAFRQYLLTEGIRNAVTLAEFVRDKLPAVSPPKALAWKRAVTERLATVLRRMHGFGFEHRDLKSSNILTSQAPDHANVWILDLDAVRRWKWLPRFRRVQNLARLNVSASVSGSVTLTDRLRFLLTYLGAERRHEWRGWWWRIASRSGRKIRRNFRVGRPIT